MADQQRDELLDEELQNESAEGGAADGDDAKGSGEPERMDLDVQIDNRSACERHITVTIPREDIQRYIEKAFTEMMPTAEVPGFRAGRAPRKLVESRFRKDVAEQVKGSLLMDSVGQVTEEHKLAAISEPDLDPFAIEVPEEGPMTFEFNLEVRPEFDLPEWKGLSIKRPVHEITEADVDAGLQRLLGDHGRLVPKDGPAEPGDHVAVDITIKHGEQTVSTLEEEVLCIRPTLSFRDGSIKGFDKLMTGAQPDDTRETTFTLTADAPNEDLRGEEVTASFDVLEVQRLESPELSPELLSDLGDFEDEAALRTAIRNVIERQDAYEQQRQVRRHITDALLKDADWELPPDLLRRQASRELERSILELRRNGFSEADIRAYENELRQNSQTATARSLKEHFILERIAEENNIEDVPGDYDDEIRLIAMQLSESPRRVRARLEKSGQMDALRNQIIERKTIALIESEAKFKDTPQERSRPQVEAIDHAAGGGDESAIPDVKKPATAEKATAEKAAAATGEEPEA